MSLQDAILDAIEKSNYLIILQYIPCHGANIKFKSCKNLKIQKLTPWDILQDNQVKQKICVLFDRYVTGNLQN